MNLNLGWENLASKETRNISIYRMVQSVFRYPEAFKRGSRV